MVVKEFEDKYKSKGGMKKLTEFRSLLVSQDQIATHFGVGKQRVRQWMLEFFGAVYDARPDRRDAIINSMVDFAMMNPPSEFDAAYKNSPYYKEALKKIKSNKTHRMYDSKRQVD